MSTPNVSIALKLGYMHAVLTEDGDVLAECGVWHAGEDDECEVAERWTVMRGEMRIPNVITDEGVTLPPVPMVDLPAIRQALRDSELDCWNWENEFLDEVITIVLRGVGLLP